MEPLNSLETTKKALAGASGTIDKALFSDLEALPASAIINSHFINAKGDVCVLYNRTILQGLDQWLPDDNGYVHGTFYPVEAFRPTVDKWSDVPAVFGKRHPDPHVFEYNQILALANADARIAGSSRTAELVDKNTGKPHIKIGLNVCDAEANRLWEAGKLGISSAFLCTQTPDGKYIVGNVRPNHIFLFERDPLTGKEQRDMAAAVNCIEPVMKVMEEIMEEAETNIGKELSSRNIGKLRGVLDDLRAHNSMVNRVCGRLEDMLGLSPDGVAKVDLESLMKRAGEYDGTPKTSTLSSIGSASTSTSGGATSYQYPPIVETIPEVPVVPMPAPQENTSKEGVSVVEPETKTEDAKANEIDVSRPMPGGTTVSPPEPPLKSIGGGGAGGRNCSGAKASAKTDEEITAESKGESPEEEKKEPDEEELVETPAEEEEEKKPKIACKGKTNMSDSEIDELVTAKVNAALAQRATEEDKAAFVNSLKPGYRKEGDALYTEYRNAPFLFQQKHANKLAIGGETNLDGAQFIGAERGDKVNDSPLSDASIAGKANTLGVRLATDSTRVGESTVGRCVYNAEKNTREWVPLGRFVKE